MTYKAVHHTLSSLTYTFCQMAMLLNQDMCQNTDRLTITRMRKRSETKTGFLPIKKFFLKNTSPAIIKYKAVHYISSF
jgi:hypothetical protein